MVLSFRVFLILVAGVLCAASSSAQRTPTYTSRGNGMLRILTLRDEGAGRISGTITQPNAVFKLRGRTDSVGGRYTGTIAATDTPNVTQNFELRRSGATVLFFFLKPDGSGRTDNTTRTLFRPSTLTVGNDGFDDGTDDSGFIDPPGPDTSGTDTLGSDGNDEFAGTFRGRNSTLTLRPTDDPRTYSGTLRQSGRSYPVTVRKTAKLSGAYRDGAGRNRAFNATSSSANRLDITLNGQTESLRRDGDSFDNGFDSGFDGTSNRDRGDAGAFDDGSQDFGDVSTGNLPSDRFRSSTGKRTMPAKSGTFDDGFGSSDGIGNDSGFDSGTSGDGLKERNGSLRPITPVRRPNTLSSNRSASRETSANRISRVAGASKEMGRHVD